MIQNAKGNPSGNGHVRSRRFGGAGNDRGPRGESPCRYAVRILRRQLASTTSLETHSMIGPGRPSPVYSGPITQRTGRMTREKMREIRESRASFRRASDASPPPPPIGPTSQALRERVLAALTGSEAGQGVSSRPDTRSPTETAYASGLANATRTGVECGLLNSSQSERG